MTRPVPKPDAAPLSDEWIAAVRREAAFQVEHGCGFADCADCSIVIRGRTVLALLAEREEARRLLERAKRYMSQVGGGLHPVHDDIAAFLEGPETEGNGGGAADVFDRGCVLSRNGVATGGRTMTDEELRKLAEQAGELSGCYWPGLLELFKVVQRDERERCAKVCEDRVHAPIITFSDAGYNTACRELASAIRRGDTGQGKG